MSGTALAMLMATNVSAQGPSSLSETYDDWTLQCQQVGVGEDQRNICHISQEIHNNENGELVALLDMSLSGNDTVNAAILMPFGLLLQNGVDVQLDETNLLHAG